MLAMNEAQLDFVLTMYSQDHPKELKFERTRDVRVRTEKQTIQTSWANVLVGKALTKFKSGLSFPLPARFGPGVVKKHPSLVSK